jgi:hypothetical protein
MSPNQRLDPNYPLAPSELVLLKGDRFAKKAMLGNVQLLHTDASVSVSQLGQAALAAAILACQAIDLIMSGMAERGALEAEKQTRLKVFTTTKYHLPEGTAGLAEEHPDEPLQALLADRQREQPQIWEALLKELKSAIKARTTQDASSSMDF